MRFIKNRRLSWSTLLLAATLSVSLLSFGKISDGQQTTSPQQALESTLQRQALTGAIDRLGSVVSVDHSAVAKLHAQLTELHKQQQEEKRCLAKHQLAAANIARRAVHPQAVEIQVPEQIENERIANLKLFPGITMKDAAGLSVSGSVTILVNCSTYDLDVSIGGLKSAADVSTIEVRHLVTDALIASLPGRDLLTMSRISRAVDVAFGALPPSQRLATRQTLRD